MWENRERRKRDTHDARRHEEPEEKRKGILKKYNTNPTPNLRIAYVMLDSYSNINS